MSKRVLLAAAILCVAGYVFVYATGRANPPIRSDGFSYYVYLPSWFIYGDSTLTAVARDCCGGEFPAFTVINRWPDTRRWVNAHPIGVAVMQSPFFLIGHGLSLWSNLSPDGFTLYYQHAAGISGLLWTVAGLCVLRSLLLCHFSQGVAAATLVALLFGTNLYHYATYDSSYSHAYSFFLFAAFLYLTERWHSPALASPATARQAPSLLSAATAGQAPSWRHSILLGVVAGLIILTRHTNALFLLVFPLYGVTDRASFRATVHKLIARRNELAVVAGVTALVVIPQLALYYQATGHVLVSSYGDPNFNFLSPHLWGVLFSVQKGLFFWSPQLLAAVAGFVLGYRKTQPFVVGAAVVMVADTYVIASWWDWQFGASYGHRGFVDTLPLLAVGLAAFFEWGTANPTRRITVTVFAGAAIGLSVFQMLQYWNGVLPMSDMTWDQYRAVFLRLR